MSSLTPDASPSPNPTAFEQLRNCAPMLASHGIKVVVFCTAIAFLLWLARPGQRLDAQLVYSFATGITSWLAIDIGRFFIDRTSPFGFPRGWRGLALILGGVCTGFVLGTLAGDTYSGRSTFGLIANQPRFFLYLFLFTLSVGSGISYFFYATGRSSYLAQQLETSRLQAAEAQLKLLQTQLEPHMLFNTLANLRALIALDPARATDMLDRLVAYLRATLQASRATDHPLQAEFDRLRDYLALMAVRMGPRLRFELTLPTALAHCAVPTLLLQPLVENSIKHGLEPKVGGGSIMVRAFERDGQLVLTVADSGVGMDDAQQHSIDSASSTTTTNTNRNGSGFGLLQVRERLATRYGGSARLTVAAPPDGGTVITLELPINSQ